MEKRSLSADVPHSVEESTRPVSQAGLLEASAHPFLAFLPLRDEVSTHTTRGNFLNCHAHDLVFEVDNDFNYRFVSPNHQVLLGFSSLELLGRPLRIWLDDDVLAPGEALTPDFFELSQSSPAPISLRLRGRNEEVGHYEGAVTRLEDGFLFVCHNVSQRERLEAELEALGTIAREISVERNLNDLLPKISQLLRPLIAFDRLFVTLLQGDTLKQVASDSPSAPCFPDLSRTLWPHQPLWNLLDTGWLWSEGDYQGIAELAPPTPSGHATRAFINVPLLAESKPVGVLHFDADQPQFWPEEQLRFARLVGAQLGAVIQGVYILRYHEEQELALAQSNALLRATQEAAAEGIGLVSNEGELISYNRRFAALWSLENEAESVKKGQIMTQVLAKMADPDEFISKISELFDAQDASSRDEILLVDGRVLERYSAPALADDGRSFGRIWTFSDITDRKNYERKLAHQAFHDSVTGLPNRLLFVNHLERALAKTARSRQKVAVLFLDLDRFKVVNDSLGHDKGDQLLIQVAERVRQSLRPGDVAARFGGDEFVILLEEVESEVEATRVADRIALSLDPPFFLDCHEVSVTASVGIVLSDASFEAGLTDDLLRKADVAMYRAKSKGKAQYEIFSEKLSGEALERLQLEIDLTSAIKRGELDVFYQPLVNLKGGEIRAFEALVRWHHPSRGMVSPAQFIPIAEETGHIVFIGIFVLRTACAQAKAWSDELGEPVLIHVNLSARQFEQATLPLEIARILRESGLPASQLMIEITESAVMTDAKAAIAQLAELKKLGVHISIDDFGTGHSSLAYLEFFPIDLLKIDRAFVSRLAEGTVLVNAIASLAHAMRMEVAAEGIETQEQLAQLRELGVEWGQGFLISKPIPAQDAGKMLNRIF